MLSAEIGNVGEKLVESVLTGCGYSCHRNTQLAGSTDIEAVKQADKILVQVKTGLFPALPPELPADERRNIASRATKLKCRALLAQLQIDKNGSLIGSIAWAQLN